MCRVNGLKGISILSVYKLNIEHKGQEVCLENTNQELDWLMHMTCELCELFFEILLKKLKEQVLKEIVPEMEE